jgi:hypothetical protein
MQDAIDQSLYGVLYGALCGVALAAIFDRQRVLRGRPALGLLRWLTGGGLAYLTVDYLRAQGEPMFETGLVVIALTLYALRGWWLPRRIRLVLPRVSVAIRFRRRPRRPTARRYHAMAQGPSPGASPPEPAPGSSPPPQEDRPPGASLRNRALRVVLDDRRPAATAGKDTRHWSSAA